MSIHPGAGLLMFFEPLLWIMEVHSGTDFDRALQEITAAEFGPIKAVGLGYKWRRYLVARFTLRSGCRLIVSYNLTEGCPGWMRNRFSAPLIKEKSHGRN